MASEPNDALFVSKLNAASLKKAKEELHELNDTDRTLAVQTLRQWVLQQDWLKSPTDYAFLLKFLRVRKFSQLEARKTLENYWTCKSTVTEWFRNVDPADPDIQKVIKSGMYVSPKRCDAKGRRIVTFHSVPAERFLKEGMSVDTLHKATFLFFEWLQCDENTQVNGFITILDYTNMALASFKALYGEKMINKFSKFYEKSMPTRNKGVYLYREPTFFNIIWAIISPFISKKLQDRIHLCGPSLPLVYKHVDKSLLPREYLPDDYKGECEGSIQQLADQMAEDMMRPEFREYIKKLSSGEYGVDLNKRSQCQDVPKESFRKLSVE